MASRRGRAALAVLALSLGAAVACAARTLDVPGEYTSIVAALAAAVAGDEVVVAPGSYSESLVVTAGITIRGSGPDRTATLLGARM
jgi:serine protease